MTRQSTLIDQHNAIVNFALDWLSQNEDDADGDALFLALAERFPQAKGRDVNLALTDVGQRLDERKVVTTAIYDAESEFNNKCLALFEGMSEDTQLIEAATFKAAQGDEFAIYLLANRHLLDREIEIGEAE